MSFSLNGNTSSESILCVPCCVKDLERCCTNELSVVNLESVNIHFYNFRLQIGPIENPNYTMIDNPYLDFNIDPFSATLTRSDLILSSENFVNYGYYTTGAEDLVSAGLNPDPNPYSYPVYKVASRLIPVPVDIYAKNVISTNGNLVQKFTVIKTNNSQFYADISLSCINENYRVYVRWFRDVKEDDIPYYPFFVEKPGAEGIKMVVEMLSPPFYSNSKTVHCDPFVASGNSYSECNPCGFHFAQDGASTNGGYIKMAYWNVMTSYDFGATFQPGQLYAYTPFNWTMDWIITE